MCPITKGFKSGGFNPVSPGHQHRRHRRRRSAADAVWGEEKVDSYEAGLKFTNTDDHRARINIAAFEAEILKRPATAGVLPRALPTAIRRTPVTRRSRVSNWSRPRQISGRARRSMASCRSRPANSTCRRSSVPSPTQSRSHGRNCSSNRKIKGLIPAQGRGGRRLLAAAGHPRPRSTSPRDFDYTSTTTSTTWRTKVRWWQTPTTKLFNGSIGWGPLAGRPPGSDRAGRQEPHQQATTSWPACSWRMPCGRRSPAIRAIRGSWTSA